MKLSYRDVRTAATTDIWHDQSETLENFPKEHFPGLANKPQVDVHITIDPERKDIQKNEAMGLNVLNQLERAN